MTNNDPANIGANKILDLGTLAEQGEAYDFHYADGIEPASYEAESFATGKKRVKKKPIKKKVILKKAPMKKKLFDDGLLTNFRKNQAIRQKNKANETKNTADAIKAMGKSTPEILPAKPKLPLKKAGMSIGMKIGIGVGIAALLGIVTYIMLKKKMLKKKK